MYVLLIYICTHIHDFQGNKQTTYAERGSTIHTYMYIYMYTCVRVYIHVLLYMLINISSKKKN